MLRRKFIVRKVLLSAFVVLLLLGGLACAGMKEETVNAGILTYLGTTEAEFQSALDDLRKSVAPLIPTETDLWENDDRLESFILALVKTRRVVRFYDSLLAMQMALRSGQVDEIVLPEAVGMYLVANNPNYEIAFSLNMMPSTISFGFKRGNSALQKEFNAAIEAMKKDGTLSSLEDKYIAGSGPSEPEQVKFQQFNGAQTIRVAVTGDMPPIDYIASDGRPAGYNTAILSEIGKRLKKNIRLVSVESGGRTAALASERVDAVFWYRNTEGLKVSKKLKGKNLGGVMKDSAEGIILSSPYYSWDTDLIIGRAGQ